MTMTFLALAEQADFDAPRPNQTEATEEAKVSASDEQRDVPPIDLGGSSAGAIKLGGFVYNVGELHLPDSRDPAVYEALFRALKTHLLS